MYLNIDNSPELAEVLIELGDIIQLARDLAHFQLGVDILNPLRKIALMLVVEICPDMVKK